MKQQAKKKSHPQKKDKHATTKVELPLPDPVPPPRANKTHEASGVDPQPKQTKKQTPRSTEGGSNPIAPLGRPDLTRAAESRLLDDSHVFGKLLRKEIQDAISADDEEFKVRRATPLTLVAQLGIVLVRAGEKELSVDTFSQKNMEERLNATSSQGKFFSRVTTSDADARYLLEQASCSAAMLTVETTHEVFIRDTAGSMLKISIPGSSKTDYTTTALIKLVGEVYVHYPTHVWDARYQLLECPQGHHSPSSEAIKVFVASMMSEGNSPSFRAMVQAGKFTVEQAVAKQIFRKKIGEITVAVAKNWDLFIEYVNPSSADSTPYNTYAVAKPAIEMQEHQRLWWDVSYKTSDLAAAGELEQLVCRLVSTVDGVGLQNLGPFIVSESFEESRAAPSKENDWFW